MLHRTVSCLLVLIAASAWTAAEPTKAIFIEKGHPKLVRSENKLWHEDQGAYRCKGTQSPHYLYAKRMVGGGDCHIHARLKLREVNHTAASFVIGGNSHFGLDGPGGAFFVQGPLFGSKTQHLKENAGLIKAGEAFDFDVVRKGDTLTFSINGKPVHSVKYTGRDLGSLGFRPWRNTMYIYDFWAEAGKDSLFVMRQRSTSYTIPTLDVAHEKWRQVIVEAIPGQYLGHPTTLLMPDNKTIFVTYPLGHGGPSAVLKKSTDGGLTWSDRLPVPENWKTARNCPCIHRLVDPKGVARIFVFEGNGEMRQSYSEDDGKTWTPFKKNGLHCVVAPITVVPIAGNRLLMHVHRGQGDKDRSPLTIWQSISDDGGLTWGPERLVAEFPGADLCEPALIRSPDGKQLASIMRENTRRYNSFLILSNDEGKTWSRPVEVPASLSGDRHMPRYAHDGRLVMTFRDTAPGSPTYGDFVAWVGTYDDMVNLREGQYRVRLLDTWKKLDLGYPGLELLPDGTFVTTTYAELVRGEKNCEVSVRFTLDELDKKAGQKLDQTVVFKRGDDGYHTYRIPAVCVTKKGTILAFCEGRKNSGSDHGDLDLVVKRSEDNGKTWGPMQIIYDGGDCTIGNPAPVVDQSTGTIWLPFCRENRRVFVTSSTDDGRTWAAPREITKDVNPDDWKWYATGPVHGIQLDSGRLLIPCDYSVENGKPDKNYHSHVIYSDDHGATWKLGGALGVDTNECTAVQLQDGSVYMNARSYHKKNCRATAISKDGGLTWGETTLDQTLVEPVCQGAVLRFSSADKDGKNRILFSNPASQRRDKMTVRVSYDEAKTWTAGQTIHWGPAAYSDMCRTPDGVVGLLYECGKRSAYETITFTRIPLDWLTGWTDKL